MSPNTRRLSVNCKEMQNQSHRGAIWRKRVLPEPLCKPSSNQNQNNEKETKNGRGGNGTKSNDDVRQNKQDKRKKNKNKKNLARQKCRRVVCKARPNLASLASRRDTPQGAISHTLPTLRDLAGLNKTVKLIQLL